jgi:hypothetical protein
MMASTLLIAQNYFTRFGPGCGAAWPVTDGGRVWISNTAVGVAAIPTREPIRIDKQTGLVTWSNGPTVEDPKTIWSPRWDSFWDKSLLNAARS